MKSYIVKSVTKTPQGRIVKAESYVPEVYDYIPLTWKLNRYFQPDYYIELAIKGWIDFGQTKYYSNQCWKSVHADDAMEYKCQCVEAAYDADMELIEAGLLTHSQRDNMIKEYLAS